MLLVHNHTKLTLFSGHGRVSYKFISSARKNDENSKKFFSQIMAPTIETINSNTATSRSSARRKNILLIKNDNNPINEIINQKLKQSEETTNEQNSEGTNPIFNIPANETIITREKVVERQIGPCVGFGILEGIAEFGLGLIKVIFKIYQLHKIRYCYQTYFL